MPDKNSSIDFIFGGMYIFLFFFSLIVDEFYVSKGPPCQSFSRANRSKVTIYLRRSPNLMIFRREEMIFGKDLLFSDVC